MKHLKLFENWQKIYEEEHDFIKDFESTEGRKPTQEEMDELYYGKGKASAPKVEYPQPDDYTGMRVGDKVRHKKTGEIHSVTKAPYHRIVSADRFGYPDYGEGPIDTYGIQAIDVETPEGKSYFSKKEDYEKVLSPEEETAKQGVESIENEHANHITQELIDRGFFNSRKTESGEMLHSFSGGKKAHNQDIRDAIHDIAREHGGLNKNVVDKYWQNFY